MTRIDGIIEVQVRDTTANRFDRLWAVCYTAADFTS
jgi:hypothetical protein